MKKREVVTASSALSNLEFDKGTSFQKFKDSSYWDEGKSSFLCNILDIHNEPQPMATRKRIHLILEPHMLLNKQIKTKQSFLWPKA